MPRLEITDMTPEEIESVWARVVKGEENECWSWAGQRNGYKGRHAAVDFGKRRGVVSRLIYELTNGQIDSRRVVRNSCHNEACINPAHLYPASRGTFVSRVEIPPEAKPVLHLWKKNRRVDQIAEKLHIEPETVETIARRFKFPQRQVFKRADPVPVTKRCPDCVRLYTGYAGDDAPHNCNQKSDLASIYTASSERVA